MRARFAVSLFGLMFFVMPCLPAPLLATTRDASLASIKASVGDYQPQPAGKTISNRVAGEREEMLFKGKTTPFFLFFDARNPNKASVVYYIYIQKDTKKCKAWIVAVDMGYGHQRAAYPLRGLDHQEVISANAYAEKDACFYLGILLH